MPILADREYWIPFFDNCAANPASMDKETYALYNAVLSIGSRVYLSSGLKESFELSQHESWGYFQNALLESTDIFYGKSSLRGIQSMLLMVR